MKHNHRLNINQCKGVQAQIHNHSFTGISLPVAQPPTSGKQLISSYSADQNQAMLYNTHFSPDNVSVIGPIILPSGNNTSKQIYKLDTYQKNKKSAQDVGLNHAASKCWNCEKEGCGGRIRKDQHTNACDSCSSKECKGKDSKHISYPCEFLLRAQEAKKFTYSYFSSSEVLWKSGIAINIFCGGFRNSYK